MANLPSYPSPPPISSSGFPSSPTYSTASSGNTVQNHLLGSESQCSTHSPPGIMTNSHDSRGILCETLFGPGNFSSWQNNVMTALGYKDLDTIVFECPKEVTPEIRLKKKQATTFIRLHLDQQNFTCFVKDPTKYKPKELWDAICDHYATKSLENVVNLMD